MRIDLSHILSTAAAIGLLAGCSNRADSGPEERFRTEVAPVIEQRCSATVCHGVRPAALERGEVELPEESLYYRVDAQGRLKNTDKAREKTLEKINTVEDARFSTLLRKPLSPDWGGLPHRGGENFSSERDPGYRAIAKWIASEEKGGEDPDFELTEHQTYFGQEVQRRLVGRNCAATNCHGPTAFIPFRLDPGMPTDEGIPAFSREMTRSNYEAARGFLSLNGRPDQSRLLRKGLPLDRGGITHRGGNRNFFDGPNDPAARAIRQWADKEREAVIDGEPTPNSTGFVFVRGPVESRSPFEVATFIPGRDLFLKKSLEDGDERNLTEDLHDGAADIRDPSVAPDGRRIVFSMRRSKAGGFQLWEMELGSGEAEQLTDDPARLPSGHPTANVTPVYGPDGWVYFASNRHDVRAERSETLDLELFRIPSGGGEIERLTFTPSHELEPSIFSVAPRSGYLLFSYRRSVDRRDQTIGFSFPLDFHRDYHIFFGRTAPVDLLYQFAEMPDGRALTITGDPDNAWTGGQLALIDRNLGPDLRPGHSRSNAAVPAFAQTYRPLDENVSPEGTSPGGIYREPVGLPDGSILVAHTPQEIDLSDPEGSVDYRIERITLDEAPEGCITVDCMPRIEKRSVIVDKPGVSEFDPEIVRPWVKRGYHESVLDPDDATRFSMADPAVNDGIVTSLAPHGPKHFREDVAYVRLVEALPQRPDRWKPIDVSPQTLQNPATTSTKGVHLPARILGEVPVRDDGSIFVEVPPNTPFRTQLLDENRMAIGRQHNRWLYVWPGQHFSESTPRGLYDQRCAGCHGSASGRAPDAWRQPDATTSASLTLARYRNGNPRKPREPLELGEETRITVDFESDVQPILDRHCSDADCHGGSSKAGGVDLSGKKTTHYSVAYENLLVDGPGSGGGNKYVDEAGSRARTSHLVEIILGTELQADRKISDHPSLKLEDTEVDTIIRWIETGAHFEIPN